MLKNYIAVAVRNLRRERAHALINILGLALGLSVGLFVLNWVAGEWRYDRFHEDGDRLYQVMRVRTESSGVQTTSESIPKPAETVLDSEYPEVENAVLTSWRQGFVLQHGETRVRRLGYAVGADYLEVFSFPLRMGNPETALDDPEGIVISVSLAEALFGGAEEAMGQALFVDNRRNAVVTGVLEDVPEASSLQFEFLLNEQDFFDQHTWVEHWGNNGMELFVRLRDAADLEAVQERLAGMIEAHHPDARAELFLFPFSKRHLWSEFDGRQASGGRIEYLRIFAVAALLVLLVACMNFANLVTARSARRGREIGVRKAIGGLRGAVARQFLGESVLVAVLGAGAGVVLLALVAPYTETLTGTSFSLAGVRPLEWVVFAVIVVAAGFLGGAYPALHLSALNTIEALRGKMRFGQRAWVRKGLTGLQFGASMILLVSALTVQKQVEFVQNRDLGFDREGLVGVWLEQDAWTQWEALKQELESIPGIRQATRAVHSPLDVSQNSSDFTWPGKAEDDNTSFTLFRGDYDLGAALGLEVLEGRLLSEEFGEDRQNFIVNEAAVRAMGLEKPVGTPVSFWGRNGHIVGVVRDFHTANLYEAIRPVTISYYVDGAALLLLRVDRSEAGRALRAAEDAVAGVSPGQPFEPAFIDEQHEANYQADYVAGRLSLGFTLIAVMISIVGLLGITSHAAQRRRRELGIRKVLGASSGSLVGLISIEVLKPVVLACLVAGPLGYVAASAWLDRFAYQAPLDPAAFATALVVLLAVAALSAALPARSAAREEPARVLGSPD